MKKRSLLLIISLVVFQVACSNDEIASVNGKDISQEEFNAYLKFKRIKITGEKHRERVLNEFLQREALAQMIADEKTLDSALLKAEFDEFKREMLISRYFEEFLNDEITDEKVSNFYITNNEKYLKNKVNVAHVLFRLKRGFSEEQRKVKLTSAHEAYSKIRKGEKFEDIVKQYSEDTISLNKGGDLGWLQEGAIDPKFSQKIFSMKKGEISEPFETAFGFHIVKVIDGPIVVKQPLDNVKGKISYQLRQQVKSEKLKQLLDKADIEIE